MDGCHATHAADAMNWSLCPANAFELNAVRWAALHARGPASPLLSPAFVAPLLRVFGTGREWLATCEQNGQIVAMAVLTRDSHLAWSTFQPPQAPIGLWLQHASDDPARLAQALMPQLPGKPLVLGLIQCDPDLHARPANAGRVRTLDYIDTVRISLPGSFEQYWTSLGKNLRSSLRKQRARLARLGLVPRLQISRQESEVAGAMRHYAALESAGWKAKEGTAIVAGGRQCQFYEQMMQAFCRMGAGRIYRYWLGDELAAMDLCIDDGEQLVVLKTSYNESLANGMSPAMLMREEICRTLFGEAGLTRIEFYGRAMDWHRRWSTEVRTLFHINVYRWAALARLHTRSRI